MAFGFAAYPLKPSPATQAVGAALLQRRQQPYGPMDRPAPQPGVETATPATIRMEGAKRMGGPMQLDHAELPDGMNANAINVAIGEAMTRVGGGNQPNPNPFKPRQRSLQQLQALGLSPIEAQLMIQTGGA